MTVRWTKTLSEWLLMYCLPKFMTDQSSGSQWNTNSTIQIVGSFWAKAKSFSKWVGDGDQLCQSQNGGLPTGEPLIGNFGLLMLSFAEAPRKSWFEWIVKTEKNTWTIMFKLTQVSPVLNRWLPCGLASWIGFLVCGWWYLGDSWGSKAAT